MSYDYWRQDKIACDEADCEDYVVGEGDARQKARDQGWQFVRWGFSDEMVDHYCPFHKKPGRA